MDIKYPYQSDDLTVGRYKLEGTFDNEVDLPISQSVIPTEYEVDGKVIILESFSIDHEKGIYTAKIDIQENIFFLPLIAVALIGGGIFLNQANATIDRVSKLALISIPVIISIITFLIILKK